MSVRKFIALVLSTLLFFSFSKFVFDFYVDVYQATTPPIYGQLLWYEEMGGDPNLFRLKIEMGDGRIGEYNNAKGMEYELGTNIVIQEFRRKFTGRGYYVFAEH